MHISAPIAAWNNWAGNQQCQSHIVTPQNISELRTIIAQARKEQATIRAYGSGHSWSNVVCPADYLINTSKLNRIISVDHAKHRVTVQAGIKLKTLNAKLARFGLALSNQAAITEQSLAGVISTATHGSGKTGTFASFVSRVQLVTADGALQTFSTTEQPDLFAAARTSIGSLGIIVAVTLQCEPLFKVQRTSTTISWKHLLQNYKQLLATNDFTQWYWNVSDDSVTVINHNRIKEPSRNRTRKHSRSSIGYSHRMLSGPRGGIYMEEEIAIPIDNFIKAARAARALVKKESQKNNLFSGILFRYVTAEKNNYISPASHQNVIFFSITTSATSGYEPFYQAFYTTMLTYHGRPHWGKLNYLTQKDTKKLYGKGFEQFNNARKKLDPEGRFSNTFTKRIFGS